MKLYIGIAILVLSLTPCVLYAQSGCVDSPENPTVVLGLIGIVVGAVVLRKTRREDLEKAYIPARKRVD